MNYARLPNTQISVEIAYAAMQHYLRGFWQRGSSEEIAVMFSNLPLLADGTLADPAAVDDFLNAVSLAERDGPIRQELRK